MRERFWAVTILEHLRVWSAFRHVHQGKDHRRIHSASRRRNRRAHQSILSTCPCHSSRNKEIVLRAVESKRLLASTVVCDGSASVSLTTGDVSAFTLLRRKFLATKVPRLWRCFGKVSAVRHCSSIQIVDWSWQQWRCQIGRALSKQWKKSWNAPKSRLPTHQG